MEWKQEVNCNNRNNGNSRSIQVAQKNLGNHGYVLGAAMEEEIRTRNSPTVTLTEKRSSAERQWVRWLPYSKSGEDIPLWKMGQHDPRPRAVENGGSEPPLQKKKTKKNYGTHVVASLPCKPQCSVEFSRAQVASR